MLTRIIIFYFEKLLLTYKYVTKCYFNFELNKTYINVYVMFFIIIIIHTYTKTRI